MSSLFVQLPESKTKSFLMLMRAFTSDNLKKFNELKKKNKTIRNTRKTKLKNRNARVNSFKRFFKSESNFWKTYTARYKRKWVKNVKLWEK